MPVHGDTPHSLFVEQDRRACLLRKVFSMDVKAFFMDVKVFSIDINCSVMCLDLLAILFVIKC